MLDYKRPKVLLIGWDAADWRIIRPLIEEGKMPTVEKMMREGVHGNLATLYPVLSPMLWTSIATSKHAFKHGIHGFTEPDPSGKSIRPITNLSRRTKAVWNILNQNGYKCNVVGWWPSNPAEPIHGVMVSDHYHRVGMDKDGNIQPPPRGAVYPPELAEKLEPVRMHASELDGDMHLAPFVPKAHEIDQEKDKRLGAVAKTLVECTNIQAAATAVIQNEPCDFMAVYFDAIDHFCHGFMKYHPPKLDKVSDDDFEMYKGVVESAYRYHDMMLETLLQMAGEDCTVLLISDHGFHPDDLRPSQIPNEPAGPAEEHREYGIFAMKGPTVKQGETVDGINLLDIVPTILTCFGLPIGRDMDGRVITEAFSEAPEIKFITSWDEVEGPHPDGQHAKDKFIDPEESRAQLEQLVALGYIEKPDDNLEIAIAETKRELKYNLARNYVGCGYYWEAIPLFEELWKTWPEESRFGLWLIRCYLAVEQAKQARKTFEKVIQDKQEYAFKATDELKKLKKENKKPEDYTEKERREIRKLQARAGFNPGMFELINGTILSEEGKNEDAVIALRAAENQLADKLGVYQKLAENYLKLKRYQDADDCYMKILQMDSDNAEARCGLARLLLAQKRNYEAAAEALRATQLKGQFPIAHHTLGIALHRLGQVEMAVKALEVCVHQNPTHFKAYNRLAYIHERRLNDPDQAFEYRRLAKEARKRLREMRRQRGLRVVEKMEAHTLKVAPGSHGELIPKDGSKEWMPNDVKTVVSGLPRSGTSMMMQMLVAGGLDALTDKEREADENNPRGYYEHEMVKSLARDNSWLKDASGKSIKIISHLLPYLGDIEKIRVIFMRRDLDEVLASQRKMIGRLGTEGTKATPAKLKQGFMKQLRRMDSLMKRHPQLECLYIDFSEVHRNPEDTAKKVNRFLGGFLNEKEMIAAVAPELYREKV